MCANVSVHENWCVDVNSDRQEYYIRVISEALSFNITLYLEDASVHLFD